MLKLFRDAIEYLFKFIAKVIYWVFKIFHLTALFFYALFGGIAHLIWNIFDKGTLAFAIYHVVGAILVVYAIIATICSVLGIGKRDKEKSEKRQSISIFGGRRKSRSRREEREYYDTQPTREQTEHVEEKPKPQVSNNKNYPIISRVKKNPAYIMVEYSDRFELYYEANGNCKLVREDLKEKA